MPVIAKSDVAVEDLKLHQQRVREIVTRDFDTVVAAYDAVQKGQPQNVIQHARIADFESRTIEARATGDDPTSFFAVTKIFGKLHDEGIEDIGQYPLRLPGQEDETLMFTFSRGTPDASDPTALTDTVASNERPGQVKIERENGTWVLSDRYVEEKFRGQGVAGHLFAAADAFMQGYADLHETPQRLTANVGQPKVLVLFLNRGFRAQTPEDQKNIDRILMGDPGLELDFARYQKEGEEVTIIPKDLYCYEKGTPLKTERAAVRINLEKVFVPRKNKADTIVDEIRREMKPS